MKKMMKLTCYLVIRTELENEIEQNENVLSADSLQKQLRR